jgi:hypothetical protein
LNTWLETGNLGSATGSAVDIWSEDGTPGGDKGLAYSQDICVLLGMACP